MSEEIRQMSQKLGSEASWVSANPILAEAEIAFRKETDGFQDGKLGDGVSAWEELPYPSDLILDAEPKSLSFNDQRGNGAYSLLATDRVLTILVDGAVTIPAGLPTGFRCSVMNSLSTPLGLTINAAYTTVLGDPGGILPGDGSMTVEVFDSSTLVITA